MKLRALTVAVLSTSLLVGAHSRAEACAAAPVSVSGNIGADAQRIFIAATPTKTEIVIEVTAPITNEDYGILIPVPARPDLDSEPVDTRELDALETNTAPTIYDSGSSGGGIGCGSAALDGKANRGPVLESVEIGPLTISALTATSAGQLQAWLDGNNFHIPAAKAIVLERYVRDNSFFIAVTRTDHTANNFPSRIGIHFTLPGEQLALALPASQLGSSETVSYEVFVASNSKVGALSPYASLTLADLDKQALKGGYRAALQAAVGAKTGRAFIIESVVEDPADGLLGTRLSQLAGSSKFLTRLSTVSTPSALTDDLVIGAAAAPAEVPMSVDVGAQDQEEGGCQASSGKVTPVLYLLLFAAYRQLRRRSA